MNGAIGPDPAVAPELAVLVVSYRRPDLLEQCLASVATHLPGHPVFVFDNRSDQTPAVRELAQRNQQVSWTWSDTNVGFARAVNILAGLAGTADVLLLNPDAVLCSDLAASRAQLARPEVAAVAPRGADGWDDAHRPLTLTRALVAAAGYAPRLRGTPLSDLYARPPGTVEGYLGGACLLISRAAWDKVGGFDEAFFLYGEEADWQRRVIAEGWQIRLADEVGVAHAGHGTVADRPDLARRSNDLLAEAVARQLERSAGVHHADAYLAGLRVLGRVQRSKRTRRRPGTARPAVLLSTNTLDVGGAERLQVQLAGELARRGYDVTMVCLQRFGPLYGEVSGAVRVIRQPWWAPAVDLPTGPAILLSNETNTECGFALLWRGARRQRRWYVAGHTPPTAHRPTYSKPLAAAIRRADGFVALSPQHWAELTAGQSLGRHHVVAANGVAPADTAPHTVPADGPLRLVMLSRIVEHKNPQLLVQALARLTDLPWTLDIFGDGPDRTRLEDETPTQLLDRVRWRGWSPGPDHALAQADVLCVPSRAEVFPMVVLEGMARGIPVLASGVCAVPEILADGAAGVVVRPVSVDAWTAALRAALTDRDRLRALGAAGRARMHEQYTLSAMTDRYEKIIAQAWR